MAPALVMHVGGPSSAALAQAGTAHDALADLESGGMPSGVLTPITILTTDTQARAVADRIEGGPGVRAVLEPAGGGNRLDGTALVTVLPIDETSTAGGQQTVEQIRADLADVPGVLGIAGSGPATSDFSRDVYGGFPVMLAVIAVVTFLLLARAFRSWLLPLKAVVLNLASLAAAYGVMVLIWQVGGISDALWGIPATGAITQWVPVMVFAFLFGLSMDYEVFILARMRETFDASGSTRESVITGIGRTGRLVTSAALILVLSFVAMTATPQTDVKILATGLAAGIVVDATIVRCLLVPALVALFGRYNWWLPRWLATMLRVEPSPLPVNVVDAPGRHRRAVPVGIDAG
jgi:RND superfamily putative drug exporter